MMFKNTQRSLLTAKRVYLAAFNTPSWAKNLYCRHLRACRNSPVRQFFNQSMQNKLRQSFGESMYRKNTQLT